MPLSPTDMDLPWAAIDISDFQRQGFTQAQPHGIGSQRKHPVAEIASSPDWLLNFGSGQNVRQRFDPGLLDDVDPGAELLGQMRPEKLQTIAVDLDCARRVRIDQLGEMPLSCSTLSRPGRQSCWLAMRLTARE